jgi:hypothetical protein
VFPGQIFFAWINETDTFDASVHDRMDEWVFSFRQSQQEGDFAGFSATIRNPRIGLLNPSRKRWAYLSIFDGSVVRAICKGRLIGVPTNLFDTLVQLDFTARPSNFVAQKTTLANTMKVLPYWDPIFVSPDSWDDPDVVLEAYSKLWHIHPVTHVVTASDVLIGENGVEEVQENQHFYDNMSVTLNSTPLRSVQMIATIPWSQSDAGGLDLTGKVRELFLPDPIPTSFTMSGLISDWPQQGDKFGSGWDVVSGSMTDVSGAQPQVKVPVIFTWQNTTPSLAEGSIFFPVYTIGQVVSGVGDASVDFQYEIIIASLGYAVPELTVEYAANREFGQVVTFTLQTDQQDIVTLPGEDESMVITLSANKVSDPSDGVVDMAIPIGDVRRRDYVHTPRGMHSVEHLLLLARANLITRSRAVETQITMPMLDALRLCDLTKNGLFHDHRLPGGQAAGKIIGYEMTLDGDQGEATTTITIASAVGKGGTYSATAGDPTWVEDDWVEDDWQERVNQQLLLTGTSDILWTMPQFAEFDDGVDFLHGLTVQNSLIEMTLANGPGTQRELLAPLAEAPLNDQSAVDAILQANPTTITAKMVPMEGGPFQHEVVISVSDLIVVKQIDLEAASNA